MYFRNRVEAGKKLAEKLMDYIGEDIVVYALPRGGVVTAFEIAKKLHAPLDLIVARKIGHPLEREYAIAAVAENGHLAGNEKELKLVDKKWLEDEIKNERLEAKRRRETYLKNQTPVSVKGKIAILVDDGIATGLTIRVGILELKHKEPKKIIVAVPVIPKDIADKLALEVDEVVALDIPEYFLGGVGAYYEDFPQVTDKEVIDLMNKANLQTYPQFMHDPLLFSFPDFRRAADKMLENLPNFHEGLFEIKRYPNGEMHVSLQTDIDNRHCFILGAINPPDSSLLSFLMLSHTLKKEGAKSITAVLPYLAYSRHDKRETGESLGTAFIGKLLETSGIDHCLTVDVHSEISQKLFPIPVTSISPAEIFAMEIDKLNLQEFVIVAPDEGARQRCLDAAKICRTENISFFKKKRFTGGITHLGIEGNLLKNAVIIDDMLDTGKTLISCCKYLRQNGVENIYIMITHGLFTGLLWNELFSLGVKTIYCTDSIHLREKNKNIKVVSIFPLLVLELKKHLENIIGLMQEVKFPQMYV